MRLVTWNCNLSLSRKLPTLLSLRPDIAVIQECEEAPTGLPDHTQYLWVGNNRRKGLGVLSFGPRIERADVYDPRWAYYLPIDVEARRMRLLAIWAFNHRARRIAPEYHGRPLEVLPHMAGWLSGAPTLIAGDFNNSVVWDTRRGKNNFAAVDVYLTDHGMRSTYHTFAAESLGKESRPTFYHTKKADKTYHIDYVYAPASSHIRNVTVGEPAAWMPHSDHVPLVVDVDGL